MARVRIGLIPVRLFGAVVIGWLLSSISPAAPQTLNLADCIERALEHNTQILVSREGVRRAEADVRSALAARLPSANATVFGFTRSRTGSSVRVQENPTGEVDPTTGQRILREEETLIPGIDRNNFALSTSVSYTIFDGGRNRFAHRASKQSLSGAEMDLQASRAAIRFAVKERYFALLRAGHLLEVDEETLKLSRKRLEEAKAKLEVGVGTRSDVLRLSVAADNAQADLIEGEQSVILARANLNHIIGNEIAQPIDIAPHPGAAADAALPEDSAALIERALPRNPEILQLRHTLEAAQSDLRSVKGERYPRLTSSLSYSRNNQTFDRVYGEFDRNYRLNGGVSLTHELFDGGTRKARVERSQATVQIARVQLEQRKRDIGLAIETAHLDAVRLAKLLRLAKGTVQLAREDLRLAEERYNVGMGRLLEVLDAQVGFTQARSDEVRVRYDLTIALADLDRLAGE